MDLFKVSGGTLEGEWDVVLMDKTDKHDSYLIYEAQRKEIAELWASELNAAANRWLNNELSKRSKGLHNQDTKMIIHLERARIQIADAQDVAANKLASAWENVKKVEVALEGRVKNGNTEQD